MKSFWKRVFKEGKETAGIIMVASTTTAFFLCLIFIGILVQDKVSMGAYSNGLRNRITMNAKDSEITNAAVDACASAYYSSFEVAKCINTFFKTVYKYESFRNVKSPDSILLNGSNCQGSAAWYDYAFTNANVTHWFSTEPEHIFVSAALTLERDKYICSFDEGIMGCEYAGLSE